MSYERRDIRGGAVETTLSGSLSAGATSFAITSATGWPDGSTGPFLVAIDRPVDGQSNANYEKILCASRTGTTVTVTTRGYDDTSAVSHSSGARAEHIFGDVDLDEANYTVAETVGKITGAGQILIADGINSLAALDVKTSGRIIVGNGTTAASVAVSGDATLASSGALTLANSGASASTYGSATQSPVIAVDAKGRITSASNTTISGVAPGGAAGGSLDGTYPNPGLASSVAGDGLAETSNVLSVNVDGSTLETSSDSLRVKDGGITQAKHATALRHTQAATSAPGSPSEGDLFFDTDDNALFVYTGTVWCCITPQSAKVTTSQTTTSTSYTDLATSGPAVSINTGTKALVTVGASMSVDQGPFFGCAMGYAVSGASTVAATATNHDLYHEDDAGVIISMSKTMELTGLTAGTNVFTAKYKVQTGPATGTFANRTITVVGIPS